MCNDDASKCSHYHSTCLGVQLCLTRTVLAARFRSSHSNEIKSCVRPLIVT
jgi:hypothetical protein